MDNNKKVSVIFLVLELAASLLLLFEATTVFLQDADRRLVEEHCCVPTDGDIRATPPSLGAVCVQQMRNIS